jgi:GR25 family glycosyltransferase involved in LPS biosynthesis
MEKVEFYCLSFNNQQRKDCMRKKFDSLNIPVKFYDGVTFDDSRIVNRNIADNKKRVWSCMYGHLDMIFYFYKNTNYEYGVFCEDDIIIHKNLREMMPKIISDFDNLKLDVLLMGYLVQFKVNQHIPSFELKNTQIESCLENYTYHNFYDQVWGTQMYMLSRSQAGKILEKYYLRYADLSEKDRNLIPFSADWTITKEGNRALMSPLVCCEKGNESYENEGQHNFHQTCYEIHNDKENFI